MPPRGHRRSDKERRKKDVAEAAQNNEIEPVKPPKKRASRERETGNPLVDYLQDQTPKRLSALVDAAQRGHLTRGHVQAALACELGTVVEAMKADPVGFAKARMGYAIRRDMLSEMIKLSGDGTGGGGDIQITINWPTPVGPPGGDQVRISRDGAKAS